MIIGKPTNAHQEAEHITFGCCIGDLGLDLINVLLGTSCIFTDSLFCHYVSTQRVLTFNMECGCMGFTSI